MKFKPVIDPNEMENFYREKFIEEELRREMEKDCPKDMDKYISDNVKIISAHINKNGKNNG